MTKLLANGCSFTWGGGFHDLSDEDREAICWPAQIGNIKGWESINLAQGCGSNQRVYRTTLEWLIENEVTPDNDIIAVIQVTEPARYEYYIPALDDESLDVHSYARLGSSERDKGWMRCKPGIVLNAWNSWERDPIQKKLDDRINDMRLSTHTEMEAMFLTIQHLDAMTSLLNSFNIPHYYWWMCDDPWNYPYDYQQYVMNKFPILDYDPVDQVVVPVERISIEDGHPSVAGHKDLAERILVKMEYIDKKFGWNTP